MNLYRINIGSEFRTIPSLLRAFPLHFLPSVSVFELSDSDGLFCTAGIISFGDVKQLLSVASFGSAVAPDEKYGFCLSYFPSDCECWPDMAGGVDVAFDSVVVPATAAATPVDDVPMPCRIVADENVCE